MLEGGRLVARRAPASIGSSPSRAGGGAIKSLCAVLMKSMFLRARNRSVSDRNCGCRMPI